MPRGRPATIADILAADAEARRLASEEVEKIGARAAGVAS
jgi:hypothetical protein